MKRRMFCWRKIIVFVVFSCFSLPSHLLILTGFSSHVVIEGSKAILSCNTSAWSEDATVIIWFRGLSGPAIYSLDRRSNYERMHFKGDKLPSSLSSSSHSNHDSEGDSSKTAKPEEEYSVPDKERLFIDRSTSIPSLIIDPVKEVDVGDYR